MEILAQYRCGKIESGSMIALKAALSFFGVHGVDPFCT